MGWETLPTGLAYYSLSEEIELLVIQMFNFLFNMSFGWYLLVCVFFLGGLIFVGFKYMSGAVQWQP